MGVWRAEQGSNILLSGSSPCHYKQVEQSCRVANAASEVLPGTMHYFLEMTDQRQQRLDRYDFMRLDRTVDVVINNAGWSPPLASVQDTTIEDWDYVMKVDARGPFLVTKAFLPTLLAKQSGHVINVATLSRKGVANACAYCATKAAVVAFGESLLAEVAPLGIRVTNVMAGTMNTRMRWNENPDFPRETVIEPDDLAQAVVNVLKMNDYVLIKEIPVHALVEEDY